MKIFNLFILLFMVILGVGCVSSPDLPLIETSVTPPAISQRPDFFNLEDDDRKTAGRPYLEWAQSKKYAADGPFPIAMSTVPVRKYDPFNKLDQGRISAKRMPGPLPVEEMDRLRALSKQAPESFALQQRNQLAPPSLGPTLNVGFDSLDVSDCCGGGASIPPDSELAVGPNHIIAVVNVAMAIYDKSGTLLSGPTTLSSFFSGTSGCNTSVFDPNVLYDEFEDRFIVGGDGGGDTYCVAATQGPDPTGSWNRYGFATNFGGAFFDYPHAGVGHNAIYMGSNQFGNSFEGRVFAMDKAAMYAGTSLTVVTHSTGGNSTPQPMNLHGYLQGTWPESGPHYIMTEKFDGNRHTVWTWDDPFGSDNFTNTGNVNLNSATGITAGFPVDWPQQGSSELMQGNDWRGLDTEYRNGKIWMTGTIGCNPGGGTVNCIRWAEIDPTGPTVLQAGVYGTSGQYRTFPDLAVNHCDDMAIGYTKGSTSMFPSAYVAGRESADAAGTLQSEVLLKVGEKKYDDFQGGGPHRWGDYSGMTIDPDGETFWYLGEYSKNINQFGTNWGNYIGSFRFNCNAPADDSDFDGLLDEWEIQFFGNLDQDANGDPDGDGFTNLQEQEDGTDPTKASFSDVPIVHINYDAIQSLKDNNISTGCGNGKFCPNQLANRQLMSLWLLKAVNGGAYTPPTAAIESFNDVDIGDTGIFGDGDFAADWIEDFFSPFGISEGCDTDNNYCATQLITKEQMAILLLKAKFGGDHVPPSATGTVFDDIATTDFAADWIEEMKSLGYVEGCDANNYCPNLVVTVSVLAKILAAVFGLVP